ncbi:MAG: aconitase X catalytic domain-containing protein [Candidatus Thermoplasmatota archaeon]|jgi:predicted aconitase|nr:aconitase X catalytic domain-containing protein [Candidatus Thermoplasmatota archaeon]MCL5984211.1 aconitase X catalytic domain-containing protein [Candidatus Thermoplasmatota archaeon]
MELTAEQEAILQGSRGERTAELMRILVSLGELNDARRLIPVWSVQLSGISFKTMGVPGTEFLEDAAKEVHVAVPTTINPAGYDVGGPGLVPVSEDFRGKQERIVRALLAMGALPTFSCTPYTTEYTPPAGAHLAWAESSAVIYSNSVLGAFSNREGAPSALASAVTGVTPEYGLHLPEGRRPSVVVQVAPQEDLHFSSLGAFLGKALGSKIPYLRGIRPEVDDMKAMGAAMSAWGSVPMFHVEGVTHEAAKQELDGLETMEVGPKDIASFEESLGRDGDTPRLIAIGCPHATPGELKHLARILREKRGGKLRSGIEFWVCTNRRVIADHADVVAQLQSAGVRVIQDTCMVVAPIGEKYPVIAVNSAKAAFYAAKRSFSGQKVLFGTTEELIDRWA